jgi:D-amino peptidase
MVGMHARAGTPDGVLCHTVLSTTWRGLHFNDTVVGEFGINCRIVRTLRVPGAS